MSPSLSEKNNNSNKLNIQNMESSCDYLANEKI